MNQIDERIETLEGEIKLQEAYIEDSKLQIKEFSKEIKELKKIKEKLALLML